jgi:formiminotetrahydrofolate cyclodeaminase
MNVRINLSGLKDEKVKSRLGDRMNELRAESEKRYQAAQAIVESKL